MRESYVWLRLIVKANLLPDRLLGELTDEADQLRRILVQSIVTAKRNRKRSAAFSFYILHFAFFIFHSSTPPHMTEKAHPTADVLDYAAPGGAQSRRPRPPVIRIVLLGLLLFPLTLLLCYPPAFLFPSAWEAVAHVKVTGQVPGEMGRAAFHINASGSGRGRSTRLTRAFIVSSGSMRGHVPQLNVDLVTMKHTAAYKPPEAPLTHEALVSYLSLAGFDPEAKETAAVAAAILDELRKLARGQLPPDVTGQPYLGQVPAVRYFLRGTSHIHLGEYGSLLWLPWYTPWCVPVWLVAWVLLARWLLRRHRRRLEQLATGSTT